MVSGADVRRAAERIRGIAHRTPVMTSASFDRQSGVATHFKCENFQRGGAFKIRGAGNLILSIPDAATSRGVVAFSSGNHAQGVAIAAAHRGMKATLAMPLDAPKSKVEAAAGYGATIIRYNRLTEDREAIGRRISEETGAALVPPYDHPEIIAGQGTAALELLEECPHLEAILTPVGGGGLLSGCATIAKEINPAIRMFGVEPELANDTWLSMRKGERVEIAPPDTIADGLRSPSPGLLTFPLMHELAEDILLVTEDEIRAAMRFLFTRLKLVVEPSGAVPAAAVLFGKLPAGIRSAGVVLSGGNMDLDNLI